MIGRIGIYYRQVRAETPIGNRKRPDKNGSLRRSEDVDPKVHVPAEHGLVPGFPGYNRNVLTRLLATVTFAVFVTAACVAADETHGVLQLPCPKSSSACDPSKADLKRAEAAFSKGLKLEKEKQIEEAYDEFDTAARLAPRNVNYITALAVTREERVSDLLKRGNTDLEVGHQIEAQAEFRTALTLDPDNEFAKQRLQDSMSEWAPKTKRQLRTLENVGIIQVFPSDAQHDFHFRGDSRVLLTQVASAYGVSAQFDDSVVTRRVHFDLDSVDFYTAMRAAGEVTNTFWTPLSDKEVFIARESPESHRQYDRMGLRTFQLEGSPSREEVLQMTNLMRVIFEIRFVQQQADKGILTVRAPMAVLDAATEFLESFGRGRPQVLLDISVYDIDHQFARDLGLHLPNNFNLFNIPTAALAGLAGLAGGSNIQSLINQLIASGGINQANSQAISGLLAQLQGQSSGIFSQPLATFGGGLTFMGLSLDHLTATLSRNESWVRLLDHAILRAGQGADATFKLGQRYPIINASFAPIFNTSAISQVLQNGSFQAPIPSFTYEDLGLNIKAKPAVTLNDDVQLDLEMQLRALAGSSENGVPVISNREYKGSINLVDGEPAIVASSVSVNEQNTLTGIPGLSQIPGLRQVGSITNKTEEDDEIMVVITPHIIDLESINSAEIWLPH